MLILVRILRHLLVNKQDTVAVDETGVKPKMKQLLLFLALVEFYLDIVVQEHLLICIVWANLVLVGGVTSFLLFAFARLVCVPLLASLLEFWDEVGMWSVFEELWFLVLQAVVEQSVFAKDFERWGPTTVLDVGRCDNPYFVQLHHHLGHFVFHLAQFKVQKAVLVVRIGLQLLFVIQEQLQEVVKVIHISNLTRNRDTLAVFRSDFTIVNHRVFRIFNHETVFLLWMRILVRILGIWLVS